MAPNQGTLEKVSPSEGLTSDFQAIRITQRPRDSFSIVVVFGIDSRV